MVARGLGLIALLALAWPGTVSAATAGWTDVHVRVYDTGHLTTDTVNRALVTAGRALAPAGVDVHWTRCPFERVDTGSNTTAPAACIHPMRAGELAVRFVRVEVSPRYRGMLPLGDALVNRDSGAGVLGTIYVDRVEWLARAAAADLASLLGSAIAHELGHLLMGTSTHGAHGGLMRAQWTREEVRRARPNDWQLAAQDRVRIKERVEKVIDVG